ncbi:MAG: PucR family transcriptional regulator, partial [Thermocrispum sp.]
MPVELGRLLLAVGSPLLDLRTGAPETAVRGLAILDPDDEPGTYTGELVLVIGARGREAARAVRTAGRHGAAAAAVKTSG